MLDLVNLFWFKKAFFRNVLTSPLLKTTSTGMRIQILSLDEKSKPNDPMINRPFYKK